MDEEEIKNKKTKTKSVSLGTVLASGGFIVFVDLWEELPCLWDIE